jgi:repressor LexA
MRPEPTRDQICATIEHHAARKDASLAALSRMLSHRDSYLWRFINYGIPDRLASRDRALLAAFFAIDEWELGARPGEPRYRPAPEQLRRATARRRIIPQ